MTSSLRNLAQRPSNRGYSAGYMQGFRDGKSGIFGDRITDSLLHRLKQQYPDNDDFQQGYLDGFKDGAVEERVCARRASLWVSLEFSSPLSKPFKSTSP